MIDKENISKFFKGKNRQSGAGLSLYISDPKHVWKIIVSVFIVLNIGIIAFSGYLFLKINSGDVFKIEEDTTVAVSTIDRTLLREILEAFEGMESEFEELKKNKPSVIDPSL